MKEIPKVIAGANIFPTPAVFIMCEQKNRGLNLVNSLQEMFFVRREEDILEGKGVEKKLLENTDFEEAPICVKLVPLSLCYHSRRSVTLLKTKSPD
jgi:hypothetical protein